MENETTFSDALLRQLIAVGQVDILVGLPTLNNAATITDVVRAVHASFTRDFPRLRTVMLNSDGGSTDGTPDLVRVASFTEADTVQTSHSLRTLHRVVAPYHGLPGKHTALRTVFAAGELTQARVVVVIDPGGPATTAERVTELIGPIARADAEFLAPRYRRHPRDGIFVTQVVRPLVRAIYGVALDEPLGAEFACSGRFASHCLEQDIWTRDAARFATDLWLRTEALAARFSVGQIWRPATTAAGTQTTLREAVRQVVLSLIESLRAHESFWLKANDVVAFADLGHRPARDARRRDLGPPGPGRAGASRHHRHQAPPRGGARAARWSRDSWTTARGPARGWTTSSGCGASMRSPPSTRLGRTNVEHLADMFVPLYMQRAAAFMSRTASEPAAVVQARLNSLCETFQRLKPVLVAGWSVEV